jgi:predicted ATPase
MLENISLENFKGFKNLQDLNVKPITILCGTNSCGKSSILQSILLLKQTLESQNPNQILLLNGRFVNLGSFENLIFGKKLDNPLVFEFTFKLTKEDLKLLRLRNSFFPMLFPRELFTQKELSNQDMLIYLKILLKAPKNENKTKSKTSIKKISVEQFQFRRETIGSDQQKIPGSFIDVQLVENNLYTIRWQNIRNRIRRDEESSKEETLSAKVKFTNLFSVDAVPIESDWESDSAKVAGFFDISLALNPINNLFKTIFSSYSYIGPLREEPSRRYIYEDEITEIGVKGENAPYIYLIDKDKPLSNHYFYDTKSNSFKPKRNMTLSNAVDEWLDLMNIKGLKSELINDIVYLNLNSSYTSKTRVSIADVGFGVSQIFPILLEGLRMPQRHTLLLEQPEIHLHPNLQMQLSDYFIALALSGKKVMVETHSDHIINRLVRRIVEDDTGTLKDLIGIYFISATDSGSVYEEVCIDENFGVTNWPVDFFDQTALEQEKILKAGIKKRQLARSSASKNEQEKQ